MQLGLKVWKTAKNVVNCNCPMISVVILYDCSKLNALKPPSPLKQVEKSVENRFQIKSGL